MRGRVFEFRPGFFTRQLEHNRQDPQPLLTGFLLLSFRHFKHPCRFSVSRNPQKKTNRGPLLVVSASTIQVTFQDIRTKLEKLVRAPQYFLQVCCILKITYKTGVKGKLYNDDELRDKTTPTCPLPYVIRRTQTLSVIGRLQFCETNCHAQHKSPIQSNDGFHVTNLIDLWTQEMYITTT